MFDREAVFIERVLEPLTRDFPELKIVLEHITTSQAVEFVEASGPTIAATVTPHHLMINRNALFDGGLRPHAYCLPVAKREAHRLAVRRAATSGSAKFFLGTDSAPHARDAKESSCGCAGIFNAPFALEAYATVFEEEGALDRLEAFASENGARNSTACRSTRAASRLNRSDGAGARHHRRGGAVPCRHNARLEPRLSQRAVFVAAGPAAADHLREVAFDRSRSIRRRAA